MWDKTITVFSSYYDRATKTDKYSRKILRNTFVDQQSTVATNQGIENANRINVYIKNYAGYIEPKKYNGDGWTLKEGDKIVSEEVTKDYTSMVELSKDYVTYTITSIDFKDYGSVPHFEVGGR